MNSENFSLCFLKVNTFPFTELYICFQYLSFHRALHLFPPIPATSHFSLFGFSPETKENSPRILSASITDFLFLKRSYYYLRILYMKNYGQDLSKPLISSPLIFITSLSSANHSTSKISFSSWSSSTALFRIETSNDL